MASASSSNAPGAQLAWPGGLFFYEVQEGLEIVAGSTVHAHEVILVSASNEERAYFRNLGRTPEGLWTHFCALKRQAQKHKLTSLINDLAPGSNSISPAATEPSTTDSGADKNPGTDAEVTSQEITSTTQEIISAGTPTSLAASATRLRAWRMRMDYPDNLDEELGILAAQDRDVQMSQLLVPMGYTPLNEDAVPATISDEYITTENGKYDAFKIELLAHAGPHVAGEYVGVTLSETYMIPRYLSCDEDTFLLEEALWMVIADDYLFDFINGLDAQPGTSYYPIQIAPMFIANSPKDNPAGHFFHCQQPYNKAEVISFHGANALQADPTPGCCLSKTIEAFIHFSDVSVKEPETYLGIKGIIVENTFKIVGISAYRKDTTFRLGDREDRDVTLGQDLMEVASFRSQHDCNRICQHLGLRPYAAHL
ncbi:hypothetical protein BOTBODRAFT_173091 [Botryobasidium botryosum FD-172 SS1]|uniref:Uncharacterized protein n=1 Tax=Botryobasidium botryosum (strain FD-172 SS1) TaxID=930990 RepID=A0A067MPF0_BOTB1|nr:hypothetical protein BOTBODRAFT_173091 [Botryobasidium botryosum FD-172 SS1]